MLATAFESQIMSAELNRTLTIVALKKAKLTRGRQVAHLLCANLRPSDRMSMVYSTTGVAAVNAASAAVKHLPRRRQ